MRIWLTNQVDQNDEKDDFKALLATMIRMVEKRL